MMDSSQQSPDLTGIRVLAAINGMELFGHERGNIEVFKALREMGAKVRVGINARESGGEVGAHLRFLKFDTFPIPFGAQWSWQWLKKHGPSYALAQFKGVYSCSGILIQELQKFQPTHIHLGSELAYSFLSLALRKCSSPLIYRMGDAPPVDSRFNLPLWKLAMRRSKRIVGISNFVKTEAIRIGIKAESISVIYNLAPVFTRATPQFPPNLSDKELALVYVGSVAEHKGLIPLMDAFNELIRDIPMLRLWIVGQSADDADFRKNLIERAQAAGIDQAITFGGHSQNPDQWYEKASLHLAPSICDEALGNVVLEAKRSGTPSIVFPSGGLPEVVRHEVDGYVCQEKTAQSLASAVRWMLADEERLEAMGRAAQEDCETRFGRVRFLQQWADVYQQTLLPYQQ